MIRLTKLKARAQLSKAELGMLWPKMPWHPLYRKRISTKWDQKLKKHSSRMVSKRAAPVLKAPGFMQQRLRNKRKGGLSQKECLVARCFRPHALRKLSSFQLAHTCTSIRMGYAAKKYFTPRLDAKRTSFSNIFLRCLNGSHHLHGDIEKGLSSYRSGALRHYFNKRTCIATCSTSMRKFAGSAVLSYSTVVQLLHGTSNQNRMPAVQTASQGHPTKNTHSTVCSSIGAL